MAPTPGPLFALAFDHRHSLRTGLLRLNGAVTADDVALCRRLKLVVFEGLLAAVERGLPRGEPAILVDEEYGAAVIAAAGDRGVTCVVPVEVSGQDELRFAHGDRGFGPAIERVDPSYVKALVRYDPAGDADLNRRQRQRLRGLQQWLDDHGRDWMLELLVPRHAVSGAVIRAVGELAADGLRPAFWKLEGRQSTAAFAAVVEAVRRTGRPDAACLVLGRGAGEPTVERWLAQAASVDGYHGFAVGRTVWWEPLRAYLDDAGSAAATTTAVEAVAHRYLRLIDVYLGAMNDA